MTQDQIQPTPIPRDTNPPGGPAEPIDGREIAAICRKSPASDDDGLLLEALKDRFPGVDFRLTRGAEDWYRIGGVVDAEGNRLARDISEWADRAFLECGQNFKTLLRYCRENGLIATRYQGVTLYIVAVTGERAENFFQIEVDRVQEVRDRLLVGNGQQPEDLEELIDPLDPIEVSQDPVGSVGYIYRRKTDVALFMEELARHHAGKHSARRFMDDWNRSSAGRHRPFCHEFNLNLHQHRGKFGEKKMDVGVMAVATAAMPRMENSISKRGTALQSALGHFDKQAGYPFAWFFYMVSKHYVPPLLGEAVHQDLDGDFAYLPHRDATVLREWAAEPYFV